MMTEILMYIGMAGGILGGILVSFRKISDMWVWSVSNMAWVIGGIITQNWAIVAQFVVFEALAINGIYQWKKEIC